MDEVKLLPCEPTPELKSCPFCDDAMMWGNDAAGDPVFFHEQTTVLGATCFLRHSLFVAERVDAWNTRAIEATRPTILTTDFER